MEKERIKFAELLEKNLSSYIEETKIKLQKLRKEHPSKVLELRELREAEDTLNKFPISLIQQQSQESQYLRKKRIFQQVKLLRKFGSKFPEFSNISMGKDILQISDFVGDSRAIVGGLCHILSGLSERNLAEYFNVSPSSIGYWSVKINKQFSNELQKIDKPVHKESHILKGGMTLKEINEKANNYNIIGRSIISRNELVRRILEIEGKDINKFPELLSNINTPEFIEFTVSKYHSNKETNIKIDKRLLRNSDVSDAVKHIRLKYLTGNYNSKQYYDELKKLAEKLNLSLRTMTEQYSISEHIKNEINNLVVEFDI